MQAIKRLPVFPMPRYGPLSTHPKCHRAAPIARELRSQFRRECRILTYPKRGFPVVIAEWPRNSRELIRVSLGHLNTCFTIDIRCWWRDPKRIFRPGRDGLTLSIKHLPKLAQAMSKALECAEEFGLTEPIATGENKRPFIRDRRGSRYP